MSHPYQFSRYAGIKPPMTDNSRLLTVKHNKIITLYLEMPLDGATFIGLSSPTEKHKGKRHAGHHTERRISRLGNGTSRQIRENTGTTSGIFVAEPVPGRPETQAGRSRAQGQPASIEGAANVDVTRLLHTEKSPQVLPAPGGFRLKCYQHPSQFLTH